MGLPRYSERARRPLALVILLLLAITLTFTIIAVSLHNLYQADIDVPDASSGKTNRLVFTVGAFSLCEDFDGQFVYPDDPTVYNVAVHSCATLTSSCKIKDLKYTVNGVEYDFAADDGMQWNCDQWNVFRAFFILSIIFTAFSIVTVLIFTKRTMDWGMSAAESLLYYYLSLGFMTFSSLCLVVSWATAAAVITEVDPDDENAKHGPAFGLAVAAWVTLVLALYTFIAYYMCDPTRKTGQQSASSEKSLEVQ